MYFSFIAPFRKLYLASSALSHGSEVKFPLFCIASGLILCKNARRTRYFKSESSCNTCFGSPTYKQITTISVLFPAVQAVTISSSCNRRLLIACFPSPIGNCMQSINWRAAVCPPQRAFNIFKCPIQKYYWTSRPRSPIKMLGPKIAFTAFYGEDNFCTVPLLGLNHPEWQRCKIKMIRKPYSNKRTLS